MQQSPSDEWFAQAWEARRVGKARDHFTRWMRVSCTAGTVLAISISLRAAAS